HAVTVRLEFDHVSAQHRPIQRRRILPPWHYRWKRAHETSLHGSATTSSPLARHLRSMTNSYAPTWKHLRCERSLGARRQLRVTRISPRLCVAHSNYGG